MRKRAVVLVGIGLLGVLSFRAGAERLGYPPSEFVARRQALAKELGKGTVVLFGATAPTAGIRFRQDNDFYYFTGNEDLNAVMVMNAATGATTLFLPKQTAGDIRVLGRNWLEDAGSTMKWGFSSIQPLSSLTSALARASSGADALVWLRLAEGDEADINRSEKMGDLARRLNNFGGTRPSEDAFRATSFRAQFPAIQLRDVTPFIDRMRTIKSPREIEIMKLNGRISAEAIRRAILATRSNGWEYEIEAEATYYMFRNGIQGNAFAAIVGSGPNVNIWHYATNGRQYHDGDLIVLDYGGALDYLGIDITRTWPAAGKFDEAQLRAYQCALEAEKAIIAAMKPGATQRQTREVGQAIYKKHGFEGGAGAGHYVGMTVHDVGDASQPFQPGMAIAVEPIIEDVSKQLHVRIEDTVLITDGEPLVLTAGVPKEVTEILALVNQGRAAAAKR